MNVEDEIRLPNGDALSPEDIAWADSCLIKDPEILDSDWNTLKDVLVEIISSHPESFNSFAHRSNNFGGVTDVEILPSSVDAESAEFLDGTDFDYVVPYNGREETNDYSLSNEGTSNSLSENLEEEPSEETLRSAFLPTYNEAQVASETTDLGLDLVFPDYDLEPLEPSIDDIFKVWDLDIPDEEDELLKQLKRALPRGSSPSVSMFDYWGEWKDQKVESIDDLVSGIADLSLNQISS